MILPSSHSLSQWGRLAENLGEAKDLCERLAAVHRKNREVVTKTGV